MKVAGHEVKNVTRDTAEVGCTKVTRAEAEALLKEMASAAPPYQFKITNIPSSNGNYVNFEMSYPETGWVSTSRDERGYPSEGFVNKFASFCLRKEQVETLLRFLANQLGYGLTTPIPSGDMYKIMFHNLVTDQWQRSGNENTRGTYTFDEATKRAAQEQKLMGCEYRAVPA